MKTIIPLILLCLTGLISDVRIHTIIPVKADKIYIDDFDNLYVVAGSSLIKYNSEGDKLFVFDSPYNEKISMADIKNPMKILVFFENQNKLIFLDNKLSLIGDEIYLENKNVYNDVLVSESESGGVWTVDISNRILIKFNSEFSEEFRKDLFEINEDPNYLFSDNNNLYIKTKQGTVFVYDNLGNYNFKLNKRIHSDFRLDQNTVQYFNKQNQSLISYNIETEDSTVLKMPDTISVQNAIQSLHYLYFNDKNNVFVSELINERKDKQ